MKHLLLPSLAVLAALPAATAELPPTPGSVEQSLRRPEAPSRPATELLFRREDGGSEHDPNDRRFRVNAFDFHGNTAFAGFRLKRVMERFVDRELNLYDLGRAADAVTEFYQRMGYPLARALVPAQRVVDGRVRIDVVEGVLGEIKVAGKHGYRGDTLLQRGGSLAPGAPILQAPLEQKLLILNDQPGLKARATLVPGKQYGSTDLLLQVEEKRLSLDVAVTNAARENIGQTRLDLNSAWNNPLGIGDQLSLRGIVSERRLLKYGKLAYSLPLGDDGSRLSLSHARIAYHVAGALSELELAGRVKTSELSYTLPMLRSRQHDRSVGISANYRELRQTSLGTELAKNHLATLSAHWNERWQDDAGTNWSTRVSISGNGHSTRTSDRAYTAAQLQCQADASLCVPLPPLRQDAERFRLEATLQASAAITSRWDAHIKAQLVHSRERLPDSDKFDLGGPDSVRAYRPSELRGDSGNSLTVELRHPMVLLNRAAQASVFIDYGRVINKQGGLRNGDGEIGGAGVGLTVYPSGNSTVKVEYARPFTNERSDDGKRGRLWFNLSASF
ncbi:ShlB/FhaC/HecB family hemolysin secretion/activation protein [Chitinimonas arctica]|uniref:ShlB/FhaC/HecB family hemolysin secretion/activation protein n=1 Tax=Chitinimonas arctica TaxID=2594795 RepID=A0A516SA01_9NEIS|nr:ShlB/FhaC/HecB family hemolysin secretion/activation protein [Chitinimonas arctica]QDQ24984.1 ShlB/FhaC/HecB family hemolysin secretion/activation protein [Chitinimonas arctica]